MPRDPARLREDRAVDPDQVAGGVDQRAAGIPGVDRGVGLDEVLEAADAEVVAAKRAHDARRDRVAETEGIADREHAVADLHAVDRAEGDRRQVALVGLQHRDVGFRVGAADVRGDPAAVVQDELDVVGALDHVMIGQHEAFRRHDHARAQARDALLRHPVREVGEIAAQERVVDEWTPLPHFLARVDVDHRRHGLLRGVGAARHGGGGHRGGSFLPQHDAGIVCTGAGEKVGPQRRHDEERGEAKRAGLREKEPKLAQQDGFRVGGGGNRSIIDTCCAAQACTGPAVPTFSRSVSGLAQVCPNRLIPIGFCGPGDAATSDATDKSFIIDRFAKRRPICAARSASAFGDGATWRMVRLGGARSTRGSAAS